MALSIKRMCDVTISLLGLLILWPLLLLTGAVIRLSMGKPVFFRQIRPGMHEEPITIVKFRTMRLATDPSAERYTDQQRLTTLGRFLRKTSLDEIPQLWSVLRGDMSLVGPRPLLMEYLPYFTAKERLRFTVRPGITGWAQIRGRNETPWDDRLGFDIWYVENWSLWLDIKILLVTVRQVFTASGVVSDPRSVMLNLDEERSLRG
jgi:sugar transferase EpsL